MGSSSRLPDFLVIGAMKAATTTMYRDLSVNPAIYLSPEKDPGNLLDEDILSQQGQERYAALYRDADENQVCGDITTEYAKRPRTDGLTMTAREVLGRDVRIIYIVRHPIDRAVSHYWHLVASADENLPPLNEAILDHPEFVDYSRYAYQIEPWIRAFGRRHVHLIRFEDYVGARRDTIEEVSRFLDVETVVEPIDPEKAYNETKDKPRFNSAWKRIRRSSIYRRLIRPLLSDERRSAFRHLLLPAAETYTEKLEPEVARQLATMLEHDVERLAELMDVEGDPWRLTEYDQ